VGDFGEANARVVVVQEDLGGWIVARSAVVRYRYGMSRCVPSSRTGVGRGAGPAYVNGLAIARSKRIHFEYPEVMHVVSGRHGCDQLVEE
jgi:hypothetical protein